MKTFLSIIVFFAQLASASATIFLPVSDGTVFDGGGANTGDYLVIAPTSGEEGDIQFASFDFAQYDTILLALNSYGVPPLGANPVVVYGYDNASGVINQSDYNAGTYIGAWTFPSDLLPGQVKFFDVTAFVKSVQGSYFGFDLQADSGVDIFSSTASNYGNPPKLVAIVRDTTPTQIVSIVANPNTLWPPDHRMIPVKVIINAVDDRDPSPISRITEVRSDEPQDSFGPDLEITGPLSVNLRAERLGDGKGRTYTIVVQCEDASGNVSLAFVEVKVPHNKK